MELSESGAATEGREYGGTGWGWGWFQPQLCDARRNENGVAHSCHDFTDSLTHSLSHSHTYTLTHSLSHTLALTHHRYNIPAPAVSQGHEDQPLTSAAAASC